MMKNSPNLLAEKFKKIKLLALDVDGVLTDGGIYYSDKGDSFRKFDAKDGMGISLLLKSGLHVCIVSAGAPGAIESRAKRLRIDHVYTNVSDKLPVLMNLVKRLKIAMSEVAYIGDDLNDLLIFKKVGLSIAVRDSVGPIKAAADIITKNVGGQGAVREICDTILHQINKKSE